VSIVFEELFDGEHSLHAFDCSQVRQHRAKNPLVIPPSVNDTRDKGAVYVTLFRNSNPNAAMQQMPFYKN
jgi:hypothetical protein